MRILKDNKIRLDKNERRIGNFIVRNEEHHVKVMDIGQIFTHRADKRTPAGQFLAQCYDSLAADESTGRGLGNWLAVIFTAFSVVPDVQWLEEVTTASEACMKRHPEAYGMPADPGTDDENAEAEAELKEVMEFEEGIKKMPDAGQEADEAGA